MKEVRKKIKKKIADQKEIKRVSVYLFILLLIGGVSAASFYFLFPYNPIHPPTADDRGATEEGIKRVAEANNKFGFELMNELSKEEKGNIFFSPYSILSALAIVFEGARGKTAEEIKSVFHFPDQRILRPNFAKIYNEINGKHGEYLLRTGNALWIQKDFPLMNEYKNIVKRYYGGKATNVDFIGAPERTRSTINAFIEEQTNGKIKDLIPRGAINRDSRLVITNAIYFNGKWKWEFNKKNTKERDFYINSSKKVKVPMMEMEPPKDASFNYAETEKAQVIELPYKGDRISLFIILPKYSGGFDFHTKESITYNYTLKDINFTYENLEKYRMRMRPTTFNKIYLPKFEFKTKYFLGRALSNMGMPTAFSPGADFSKMTKKSDLSISQVIHQAYVKVDEKGTEAAAATGVVMTLAIEPIVRVFKADHPFFFVILDKKTGEILFMGRIVDPRT